jgi:nitric oxide reductase subunit B
MQVLNMWSFWIMTSAVAFMTFTLTFAGIVQTHLQRVQGKDYMVIQDQIWPFYVGRLGAGVVVILSVLLFVYAVLGPVKQARTAGGRAAAQPAE